MKLVEHSESAAKSGLSDVKILRTGISGDGNSGNSRKIRKWISALLYIEKAEPSLRSGLGMIRDKSNNPWGYYMYGWTCSIDFKSNIKCSCMGMLKKREPPV